MKSPKIRSYLSVKKNRLLLYIIIIVAHYLIIPFTNNVTKDEQYSGETRLTVFQLNDFGSIFFSNDTYDQITLTQKPNDVINSFRNLRPLYIYTIGYPYKFFSYLINYFAENFAPDQHKKIFSDKSKFHWYMIWGLYVLTNGIIIFILSYFIDSYFVPFKSANSLTKILFSISILIYIIQSNIVTIFLYSNTWQFFHLLIYPILLFTLTKTSKSAKSNVQLISLFLGVLTLYYNAFVITFLSYLIFILVTQKHKSLKVIFLFTSSVSYMFPIIIWISILNLFSDLNKSAEFDPNHKEWRLFIWVFDYINEVGVSGLVESITLRLNIFANFFFHSVKYQLMYFLIIFIFCFSKKVHIVPLFKKEYDFFKISFIFILISSVFWFFMGIYSYRYLSSIPICLIFCNYRLLLTIIEENKVYSNYFYFILVTISLHQFYLMFENGRIENILTLKGYASIDPPF